VIDYGSVISQIRTVLPTTFGAVAGAASLESIELTSNPILPAAFVVPLSMEAEPNVIHGGGLKQYCTETFGVVVIASTGDLRGQQAANTIPAIRVALWSALLNWRVDSVYAPQGLYYHSDELIMLDSGRTFWVFKYSLDIQISYLDGYQVPSEPLLEVSATIPTTTAAGGTLETDILVTLPQ
jgi:hypothetical protein